MQSLSVKIVKSQFRPNVTKLNSPIIKSSKEANPILNHKGQEKGHNVIYLTLSNLMQC